MRPDSEAARAYDDCVDRACRPVELHALAALKHLVRKRVASFRQAYSCGNQPNVSSDIVDTVRWIYYDDAVAQLFEQPACEQVGVAASEHNIRIVAQHLFRSPIVQGIGARFRGEHRFFRFGR